MAADHPVFWLIAGPNGVGKTTYAFKHLKAVSGTVRFINLDEIARGLSPLEPLAAERDSARIALARAEHFIKSGETFSMETTLSGATHMALAKRAKAAGMLVHLLYFTVNSPAICLERIARRVSEGGYSVAVDIVHRCFSRSMERLKTLAPTCDLWRVYEASGPKPKLAVEGAFSEIRFMDRDVLAEAHATMRQWATTP